jgi:glycosyl transferase family 25
MGVIGAALAAGHATVLILEDDLGLHPARLALAAPMLAELARTEWDFAYLGHDQALAPRADSFWQASGAALVGAHCYALKRSVLPALHAYLQACLAREAGDPAGGRMHVDGAFSMFRQADANVRTVLAVPMLGYQRSSRSDICANRWFDRLALLRGVVDALRALRQRWRSARGMLP